MNEAQATLLAQAELVASRLERLAPDSIWQRRASGTRGALLKLLEKIENGERVNAHAKQLMTHIEAGYKILESAAQSL